MNLLDFLAQAGFWTWVGVLILAVMAAEVIPASIRAWRGK